MDPLEIEKLVEGWAVLGFEPIGKRPEGAYWQDLCVVDWRLGGPTLPCDWLSVDVANRTAHLKGTYPGSVVWRGQPRPGPLEQVRLRPTR